MYISYKQDYGINDASQFQRAVVLGKPDETNYVDEIYLFLHYSRGVLVKYTNALKAPRT
jgi:hypothetical protein